MIISKTYEGWWWLPDNKDYRIPGTLEIKPDNSYLLTTIEGPIPLNELIQTHNLRTNEPIHIINGIAKETGANTDRIFTLVNCFVSTYSGSTLIRTGYSIQHIAFDCHFSELSSILSDKVFIKPQFIDDWIISESYKVDHSNENEKFEYTIKYEQPKSVSLFECEDFSVYLYFSAKSGHTDHPMPV